MKTLIDKFTGNVKFFYKIINGQSSSSFGIKVAEMMKLPNEIIVISR